MVRLISLPTSWNPKDSLYPELFALTVAAFIWAPLFTNKSITFHCDNAATVFILAKRSVPRHRSDILYLVKSLTKVALISRFYFWVVHIPGVSNIEADALSRFKINPFRKLLLPNRPLDQHIAPFFKLNPNYPNGFIWKQSHIIQLAQALCNQSI